MLKQTVVRLPEELHYKIKVICAKDKLSLNALMIKLLEIYVKNRGDK